MKFRALAAIAAGLIATTASVWLQAQAGQTQLPELPIVRPAAAAPGAARVPVLIELQAEPAAVTYAAVLARVATRDAQAIAAAATAGRAQVANVQAQQRQVAGAMAAAGLQAAEIFRVQRAMNGIAATVNAADIAAIGRLPGVKAVHRLRQEFPTNATSVPFIGAPSLWDNSLGIGGNITGAGVRIGVIDTGIDYQHADFGGTGLLADYQANDRTVAPDTYFPTAKVVGGWDFAGDAYTGSNAPTPDPDPMDCNGHGTHVAGTAAGYGVNADGTTFAGPFSPGAPFASLRIGPGAAPHASLYALRVFGCTGGTNLTVQAIDWAMDPNGDNDLSDHLDVINMSLGSTFGDLTDTTAIAADNAAAAGVIVVAAAGNAGDTYFINGSPAIGNRVISTAASDDPGVVSNGLVITAPSNIAGAYSAAQATYGPQTYDVTGFVVQAIDPADGAGPSTTDGCSPFTNAAAITGNIALIDRGTCGFTTKTANAQAAGAVAVIIANTSTTPASPGGSDPTIVIPTVMVQFADGNTLKANLSGLAAHLLTGYGTTASFSSRGPRIAAPGGGMVLKPDIAAPGLSIVSAQTGVTCTSGSCMTPNASGFLAGSQSLNLQGTSMASPHVAGVMALLRQLHPEWTVEELKALVMNTALHDLTMAPNGNGPRFGPGRVGAGRVDAALAATAPLVAFNADGSGQVSLSFDGTTVGTRADTKTLRLVNHGTLDQSYDLAIDTVVDAPGVSYSLPNGNTITVPAGESVDVDVTMTANAAQMKHTRDATVSATQTAPSPLTTLGNLPRHWLTEEASYLTFSVGSVTRLRVPLYTAAKPASSMFAAPVITTGGAPTGSTTIPLAGSDVCTGTLGAGPTCTGTFPTDEVSLVSPFELQVVSPADPLNTPGFADIQYAGVSYDAGANQLTFGVSTWEPWSTPGQVVFNIYIDTNNDGVWDRILFATDPGNAGLTLFGTSAASSQDTFQNMVFNISTSGVSIGAGPLNRVSAGALDTRVFDNQVAFLTATPAQLGITGPFKYKVVTCPAAEPLCLALDGDKYDEAPGPYTFDRTTPGLTFGGTLAQDLNGASIPVTWNIANLAANGSLGALLLHHHNVEGQRAQVVTMQGDAQADLGITLTASTTTPAAGQQVTLTYTVTNIGPSAATGVQTLIDLPAGVTYLSDDSGGSYDSGLRLWTVGSLASSASATLHLTVTADVAQPLSAAGTVMAASPLDANQANNHVALGVTPSASADLQITAVPTSVGSVPVGQVAQYLVTVKNVGSDTAYNVTVANTILGSGSVQSGSPSDGLFTPATGQWRIASLGRGATATLSLRVVITAGPTIGDRAQVSSSVADPNSANNIATAQVAVTQQPTTTTLTGLNQTLPFRDTPRTIPLSATVASVAPIDGGTVTFTLKDSSNATVGTPVTSATLTPGGVATADYILPGNTPPGLLTVHADYSGTPTFQSSGASTQTITILADTFTYLLAEGATGSFFHTDILLANPNSVSAPIQIDFLKEDGSTLTFYQTLPATSRTTLHAETIAGLDSANFSTVVTSVSLLPLVVERTMTWDASGYGAHGEKASSGPATTWFFAEGSQGFFHTYFLLVNPQATANVAHVTYVLENASTVTRDYPLAPKSRLTIDAGADAALVNQSFGATVVFDQAGMAERSMYFNSAGELFAGGDVSAGVTAPSMTWYLAEGATGTYFNTFVLIANPGTASATATVNYLLDNGSTVTKTHTIAGHQRLTINVADEDPTLISAAFATTVTADQPVVVERSQYWPAPATSWIESHNSEGVVAPGTKWGLAEGQVGGANHAQTYILVANPNAQPAALTVTFLRSDGTTVVKTFSVGATSRFNIAVTGAGSSVPELQDESFGAVIESTVPVIVERSMYTDANGVIWAAGTNATGTRLP